MIDYWPRTYACMAPGFPSFPNHRPDETSCTLPSGHLGEHRYGAFRAFALPEEDPCNPESPAYRPRAEVTP